MSLEYREKPPTRAKVNGVQLALGFLMMLGGLYIAMKGEDLGISGPEGTILFVALMVGGAFVGKLSFKPLD